MADPFVISGWEIGPGSNFGVDISNTSSHVVIRQNWIHGLLGGAIRLNQVSNLTIGDNFLLTNWTGVTIAGAGNSSLTIVGNEISGGLTGSGSGLKIGISVSTGVDQLMLQQNHIYSFQSGLNAAMYATNLTNTTIDANTVHDSASGLNVCKGSNVIVSNNECYNLGINALEMLSVASLEVRGNYVHDTTNEGVEVNAYKPDACPTPSSGDNVLITGNTFLRNQEAGVKIFNSAPTESGWSHTVQIYNNDIEGNQSGILVRRAKDVRIENNTVSNNTLAGGTNEGITLDTTAGYTIIRHNSIDGNHAGIDDESCTTTQCVAQFNEMSGNDVGILAKKTASTRSCQNHLVGNGVGVDGTQVSSGSTYDALDNWWGAASGPSGAGPGTGDAVTGSVAFNPWLTAPVSGVGVVPGADPEATPADPTGCP